MLTRLLVRNYVLIDSLEIDFPEGLIIITGQTGAGKSILLGALSLITGSKAEASMVSEGAENCVVEAEFDNIDQSVRHLLDENDVEWEDGHIIVRRVVNRSGRSRAFVNDSPVSVSVLQELSASLIDIHSQHQTLLLSDSSFQLGVLDSFAGNSQLRETCASLWKKNQALKNELSQLEARISRISAEKEYNEAQFRQLDAAKLRQGELEELEEEHKQLSNAEDIKEGLSAVEELFTPSEGASIDVSLKEADKLLAKVGRYVPEVLALAERIGECRRELDDVLSEVTTINSRVDMSADRLEQVEDRMSLIYGLLKKHGCADVAELISLRDRLSEELYDSTRISEEADNLRAEIAKVEAQLEEVADQLHESRAGAASGFAEEITASIRGLELSHSVFEVHLAERAMSSVGRDAVVFRFSASGASPVDLSKCASGGEMSRIMLSLKSLMARYRSMPTMIFDEIDTGVSGSVADKMGTMICDMGAYMQVFAITHLPQVAAKGNAHYLVSKEIEPLTSKAVSTISRLSDQERVMEVARMLSGSVLTDAAIANAKSLLA